MFSRTFDEKYLTNIRNLVKTMSETQGSAPPVHLHTWELYDKAFSFPRVRRYQYVQENMDMLEHFQDNVNLNIDNNQAMDNFLRVARSVRSNLNAKYHDGEFDDPANHDPREEAEADPSWATARV